MLRLQMAARPLSIDAGVAGVAREILVAEGQTKRDSIGDRHREHARVRVAAQGVGHGGHGASIGDCVDAGMPRVPARITGRRLLTTDRATGRANATTATVSPTRSSNCSRLMRVLLADRMAPRPRPRM
jgi:hypothetical protein